LTYSILYAIINTSKDSSPQPKIDCFMTKKYYLAYPVGSAARVIAHAQYRASRGKKPSMAYLTETNPRKALEAAHRIEGAIVDNDHKEFFARKKADSIIIQKRPYDQLTPGEAGLAMRRIIVNSSDSAEVARRFRDELGCPYTPCMNVMEMKSSTSHEARDLCLALGGVALKTGQPIMLMVHGPDGETIVL
jgi:hypothetical protein